MRVEFQGPDSGFNRIAAHQSSLWEPAEPTPWKNDAACRGAEQRVFFTERGESQAAARAICAVCPVTAECLDYAMRLRITDGVWGGKSERQRRALRVAFVRMVPCGQCGERFEYTHPGQRYCAKACQAEAKRLSNRRYREAQ